MKKESSTIISVGIFITTVYIILGLFFPQYDWDIASWMATRPYPLSLNFYDPIIPHSILPGLIVGLVGNITESNLLFLHIVLSCLFTGIGITIFMLLCFKITDKVIASIIVGIIFAISRTTIIISLTGENDLFSISFIVLLLYYLFTLINDNKLTGFLKVKNYILLSFFSAWLTIFHLQLTVIGLVIPGITIFALEFYFNEKKITLEQFKLILFSYSSYITGLVLSFSLMSIYMNYDPATIDLLTKFFDLNFATASSFSQNPNWSFLASGRTPFEQLDIWVNGLVRAFFFVQYVNPFDIIYSPDFIFILASLAFLIIPIIDYFYRSSTNIYKKYFFILILTELAYSCYMFFYEPQSLERWSPFLAVILWHNALIIKFPVFENFNFDIIRFNQQKSIFSLFIGIIFGFIVDTNIIADFTLNKQDIYLGMNILAILLIMFVIFTNKTHRSTKFPIFLVIALFIIGFFVYFWLSRVFLTLITCQASQAGWC